MFFKNKMFSSSIISKLNKIKRFDRSWLGKISKIQNNYIIHVSHYIVKMIAEINSRVSRNASRLRFTIVVDRVSESSEYDM